MSLKEICNQNATKAKAVRDNAYKILTNKYIEQDPCKPIIASMKEQGIDKYKNANIQAVAVEFSCCSTKGQFKADDSQ